MRTLEQNLVARAGPHVQAAQARQILEREASLGCTPNLAPYMVELEPPFRDLMALAANRFAPQGDQSLRWVEAEPHGVEQSARLRIWLPPETRLDWTRAELFLRQLSSIRHRVVLDIVGNSVLLYLSRMTHSDDLPILLTAFRAWYPECEIGLLADCPLERVSNAGGLLLLRDLYPPPPYSHCFTTPQELKRSPLEGILAALAQIPAPNLGLYQVLFQPVSPAHNWHRNVEFLLDLEYAAKLLGGAHLAPSPRHPQQSPSGDLHHMAQETESKAHNDKPFFAVSVRTALFGENEISLHHGLDALSSALYLFQHGGRPLCDLSEAAYLHALSATQLLEMWTQGRTYRAGFLLNSAELSGLVHVPPADVVLQCWDSWEFLETLFVRDADSFDGAPIGTCNRAGREQVVRIPAGVRSRSTHLIARHGMGKSTLMEHMVLHDLEVGQGVAVLDPHGDLVQRLLGLIPEKHLERVIYFSPGDPQWVPLWNPLHLSPGQDLTRTADDLLAGIKSIVQGWGDRLEHLLRHSLVGLLHLPDATLLDVADLLSRKSPQSKRLRECIAEAVDNVSARSFWKHDFETYENAAFDPPRHKLSKLLVSGTVSLMLSQPENRIDLRAIMDGGLALLVDLSTVGTETRQILGSFILSLMHTVALGRSGVARSARRPFHIYCDEAHRFVSTDLEDLLVETRKFGVYLTLAHQFLRQFGASERDALGSVGATVIFNVNSRDAGVLLKDLRGLVTVDDLITLEVGQAVARIGTELVRLRTFPPLEIPENSCRQKIIERSHRLYCRTVEEIKSQLSRRNRRWDEPFGGVGNPESLKDLVECEYDKLD